MWGGIIGLIIQLISGAVGGNIAGAAMKQYNLGTIGNSIAGLIGGGVGAQIIGALGGGGAGGPPYWLDYRPDRLRRSGTWHPDGDRRTDKEQAMGGQKAA